MLRLGCSFHLTLKISSYAPAPSTDFSQHSYKYGAEYSVHNTQIRTHTKFGFQGINHCWYYV